MNDSALSHSALFHTPVVHFCLHFTESQGKWQSSVIREFSSLFLSMTLSHRHTLIHTRSCIWPHAHYNTTGCCRVDVWGVKVHTGCDKHQILRNNYSLFSCLIDAYLNLVIVSFFLFFISWKRIASTQACIWIHPCKSWILRLSLTFIYCEILTVHSLCDSSCTFDFVANRQ